MHGKMDDTAAIMVIALENNWFYLKGFAYWLGKAELGQAHIGEIDGLVPLQEGKLFFEEDSCTAEIHLESSGIIVEKESGCGGLNVTFEGEYKKQ